MTDRKLLELAAKAAGITAKWVMTTWDGQTDFRYPDGSLWNPLTDDGDALRLAVKLNMEISFDEENGNSLVIIKTDEGQTFDVFAPDKYIATRRAIVRAAAEIGKQ